MKPQIALNFRISTDESGNQRFDEYEILDLIANGNVDIDGQMLFRESDGKIIGELMDSVNVFSRILNDIDRVNDLDSKSIPEKVLKFNEEFGEFTQELGKLIGMTHKVYDEEHFIEESADSLQVLISIQLAACKLKGIPYDKVLYALLEKNKKWEAKLSEYTRDKK
jgi:NTP pyrophosphatase (non-canonical NTP hydrolase)